MKESLGYTRPGAHRAAKDGKWLSQVGDLLERRSEIRENQRALAGLSDGIARVEPALKELALPSRHYRGRQTTQRGAIGRNPG
jgi:hypothetical protein